MKKQLSDLRTIHGASSETGLPRSTIYLWIETGRIQTHTLDAAGDALFVRLSDVQKLIESPPKRGRPVTRK